MSITFDYDLPIKAGATYDETFTWLQTDNATPVDLTGVSARLQLRVGADVADPPLVDLTTANGGIVITAAQGKVRVIIAAALTAALPSTGGVYDLVITWPDGSVQRLMEGSFSVSPRVTR